MKIIVDENIPLITVNELVDLGHNIIDIRNSSMEGMADLDLWDYARKQRRLLIKDFLNINILLCRNTDHHIKTVKY